MKALCALICLIASPAFAQYHAGSNDCDPLTVHTPSADVEAKDGFDHRGKPVAPADASPSNMSKQFDNVNIGLDIPMGKYVDQDNYNADFSETEIELGTINVAKDGATTLNGEPITPQNMYSTECQ